MPNILDLVGGWPWKIIGIAVAGLAAIAAIIAGANIALSNARKAGRAEVQAEWDAEKAGAQQARAELSEALSEAFNGLDGTLQNTIKSIAFEGQQITVRVKKELDNDPRYSSAECSLTDSVRGEINAARGLSGSAAPAAIRDGGVPASGAAVRLEFGDTGRR